MREHQTSSATSHRHSRHMITTGAICTLWRVNESTESRRCLHAIRDYRTFPCSSHLWCLVRQGSCARQRGVLGLQRIQLGSPASPYRARRRSARSLLLLPRNRKQRVAKMSEPLDVSIGLSSLSSKTNGERSCSMKRPHTHQDLVTIPYRTRHLDVLHNGWSTLAGTMGTTFPITTNSGARLSLGILRNIRGRGPVRLPEIELLACDDGHVRVANVQHQTGFSACERISVPYGCTSTGHRLLVSLRIRERQHCCPQHVLLDPNLSEAQCPRPIR